MAPLMQMAWALLAMSALHTAHSSQVVGDGANTGSTGSELAALQLWVHPTSGADDQYRSGTTAGQPLRTLAAAQLRLRAALAAYPLLQATVRLQPGVHAVPPRGLRLTAADSPSGVGGSVRWLGGGKASISGGVTLSGWRPVRPDAAGVPAGVWATTAPIELPGGFVGRHLTVDGKRAPRTRRFAAGLLQDLELQTTGSCATCAYTVAGKLPWNSRGAELIYSAGGGATWAEPRCAIKEIQWLSDQNRSQLKMMQPCFLNLIRRGFNPRGNPRACAGYGPKSKAYPSGIVTNCTLPRFVENVREHLEPGQFYHDVLAQRVLYFPRAGQDMAHVTAVLAVEEQLVHLSGAMHHTFDGIAFEHATWLRPGQGLGYIEAQAGACDLCPVNGSQGCVSPDYAGDYESLIPGNVAVTNGSRSIEFIKCIFRHLGATAASTQGGSQGIAWRRCSFTDVSAGAVVLGDVVDAGPETDANITTPRAQWDTNLTVEDCTIVNLPVEYSGATAIFAGYVSGATIQHNLIANTSANAIALGWGWGRDGSGRGDNRVLANRIDGVGLERCCDLGAIYTLGPQPRSTIRANHITQRTTPSTAFCPNCFDGNASEGMAVYHDNGSGGFVDAENVIDGIWDVVLLVHTTLGPFGPPTKMPGGNCPGCDVDANSTCCDISFTSNWVHVKRGVWPPSKQAGGTTPATSSWLVVPPDNVVVPADEPLPAAAAAIVSAAGPRHVMLNSGAVH